MTKKKKLVDKILTNATSLKLPQIITILEHEGSIQIQAKGSHVKFKHPKLNVDLVIPVHNKDYKNHYKEQAKKFLETIK